MPASSEIKGGQRIEPRRTLPANIASTPPRPDCARKLNLEPLRIAPILGPPEIPDEEGLAGQLAAPGYHINTGGRLVIESKAEMAKRGIASRTMRTLWR